MKNIILILISSLILTNCNNDTVESLDSYNELSDSNFRVDDTIIDLSIFDSIQKKKENSNFFLEGDLIIKISNKEFFKSSSVQELFNSQSNHQLGFIVPLSFCFDSEGIYIPNRFNKSIQYYSYNGKFMNEILIPKSFSPDFIALTENRTFLVNDLKSNSLFELSNGILLNTNENHDMKFSHFDGNYLYRKNRSFFDLFGNFNGEFKFNYLEQTYDYSLISSSSFGLLFFDNDAEKLKLNIINKGGLIINQFLMELAIDIEDYTGVKILNISDSECCFVVLNDGIGIDNIDKLVYYNFNTKQSKIFNFKINYSGPFFIGEGAHIWSGGVIFKYNNNDNSVYSLFTGKDNIYVYKFKL
jgi:hypothetical protein